MMSEIFVDELELPKTRLFSQRQIDIPRCQTAVIIVKCERIVKNENPDIDISTKEILIRSQECNCIIKIGFINRTYRSRVEIF